MHRRQWCPGDSVSLEENGVEKSLVFHEMVVLQETMNTKDGGVQDTVVLCKHGSQETVVLQEMVGFRRLILQERIVSWRQWCPGDMVSRKQWCPGDSGDQETMGSGRPCCSGDGGLNR